MAVQRVQIGVNFAYNVNGVLAPIPLNTGITVTDRVSSSAASVYAGLTGSTMIAQPRSDGGGNVPGFVVQGSYLITAAPVPSATPPFAGASLDWEAVRGDGVENYAPNSIPPGALQSGIVQGGLPAGVILDYGGTTAPSGFLLCDGSSYLGTTYPGLYAAISTTHGGSGGSFNVPDLRGRTSIGVSGSGISGITARIAGTKDGFETHLLTNSQMPVHNHGDTIGGTTGPQSQGHTHTFSGTTGDDSPDHSHNFQGGANNVVAESNVGSFGNVSVPLASPGTGYNVGYSAGAGFGVIGSTGGRQQFHQHGFGGGTLGVSQDHTHAIGYDGGGPTHTITAHNNMQPFTVVQKIIKT